MKNIVIVIFQIAAISLYSGAFCQTSPAIPDFTEFEVGTLPGSFSVTPSGAAIYTIPLDLPPGRAGLTPSLGLVYNSQQRGNILGKCWGLAGFSFISRTNPTIYYNGQPDNIDFEQDQYLLDGQRLILTGDDEYRPENDPSLKIEYLLGDFGDYFKVSVGNGIIKEYGNTLDSRQEYSHEGPDACPLIWHLNKIIDPQGNTIIFEYFKNIDHGELHPARIIYTGYEEDGQTLQEGFYKISFDYDVLEPAHWQTYYFQKGINPYMNVTSYLLKNIYVKFSDGNQTLRTYGLIYSSENTSVLNEYFLQEIDIKVPADQGEKVMKGASFDWTFYHPDYQTICFQDPDPDTTWNSTYYTKKMCKINITGSNKDDIVVSKIEHDLDEKWKTVISLYYNELSQEINIPISNELCFVEPMALDIDFNGDDELIFNQNGVRIYDFEIQSESGWIANLIYSDANQGKIKSGDIDGDGIVDFFLVGESSCKLYKGTGNIASPFVINEIVLPFSSEDELETVADFNGDGKADILWRDYPDFIYKVYSYVNENEFEELTAFYLNYSNFSTEVLPFYVDLNGDMKTDFIFKNSTERLNYLDSYFSYGDGHMGKNTLDISEYLISPTFIMDMNNDGLADYIELFDNQAFFKIAYGMPDGINLSPVYSFDLNINESKIFDLVMADIDGNGVEDLVTEFYEVVPLYGDAPIPGDKFDSDSITLEPYGRKLKLYCLQDEGFSKDLISTFENGFGAMTKVNYNPSNQIPETYGEYPVTKYRSKGYVVSASWMSDGQKNINQSNYQYFSPLLHCAGKGFLGYESIQVENRHNNTVTITENSIYHEGTDYYFLYPAHVSTYTLLENQPDVLLTETINSMHVKVFQNTDPPVYRPVMPISQTNSWDNDMAHSFISSSAHFINVNDIDSYGNLLRATTCKDKDYMSIHNPPADYEYQTTQNVIYLTDDESWVITRPISLETVSSCETDPVDNVNYTEFTYYEPGESGSNGIFNWPLLKTKTTIPNYDDQLALRVTYEYDKYGNIFQSERTAPNAVPSLPAVTSLYTYDENMFGRFLTLKHEGTRNHPFITAYQYDALNAHLLSETNPQGLQTIYEYDQFGRLKEITPPTNIKIRTLLASEDIDAHPNAVFLTTNMKILNTPEETESEIVKIFFNRFEQEVRSVSMGLNGTTIYRDKEYDEKGRLWKVSDPYFKGESPLHWVEYRYDDIGRVDAIQLPTKSITTHYHGRCFTTTDEGTGISVIKTLDALGREIEISDPSGVIKYEYYSSGLVKNIDALGSISEFTYDAAGNQLTLSDPDAGTIEYDYNAYGQMIMQSDAKGNSFTMIYDELSRLSEKILIGEGVQARYTYYDVFQTPGYGLPEIIEGMDGVSYSYDYDEFSRLHSFKEDIDGKLMETMFEYNPSSGKPSQIVYPTGSQFAFTHDISSGELITVYDCAQQRILWQANSVNARGQLTAYSVGDNMHTYKTHDDLGFPTGITTWKLTSGDADIGPSGPGDDIEEIIQNLAYEFDHTTGNLLSRASNSEGVILRENFTYDDLLHDRLTGWQVEGQALYATIFQTNGNILAKSGVTSGERYHSTYVYGQGAGPHAVTGITIPTQEYRLHCTPQDIVYTPFNKAKQITQEIAPPSDNPGDDIWKLEVVYGPDEQRKRTKLYRDEVLIKTKYFSGNLYEEEHTVHGIRKIHYLYGGDGLFGIYVMNGGNDTMYYIHKDYLGSYDVISDEAGNVLERLNFDPWGRRRNANDWTYDNVPSPRYFDRGYTGHEHLDVFGLINMNGRVYDPWLGRFLSPDPFVQSPGSSQSYNRYSYCLNNPLKYIDPSGYKQKPFYPWEAQPTYSGGWGFDGRIGPGSGNHWSDQYSGADMSSPGSYTYNWSDGKYYDRYGNRVSFDEVFANYVLPNSVDVPYSLYLPSSNQPQKGNNNHQQNVQPVITYDFIAAISHIILSNSSMMFGGSLQDIFSGDNKNFPAFFILWKNYPHDIDGEHQHPSSDIYAYNQCAIRLGLCLQNSGVDMSNYDTGPVTSEGYPRGAKSLADWLWKEFGRPTIVTQTAFECSYWNQTGIIYIAPPSGAAPHIDLFNKGTTGSGYYLGTSIWFWKIE